MLRHGVLQRKDASHSTRTSVEDISEEEETRDDDKQTGSVDWWQGLEQETGHNNYGDYAAAFKGRSKVIAIAEFSEIERHWKLSTVPLLESQKTIGGSCSMYDVFQTGRCEKTLSIHSYLVKSSATRILRALSTPPVMTRLRILVLNLEEENLDQAWCVAGPMLNAVGLKLRIAPWAFEALLTSNEVGRENAIRGHPTPSHCIIGNSIIVAARDYATAGAACPLVVVVLDSPVHDGSLPHTKGKTLPVSDTMNESKSKMMWPEMYKQSLERYLDSPDDRISTSEALYPKAVLSAIETHIMKIREQIKIDRAKFMDLCVSKAVEDLGEARESTLENMRFRLREQSMRLARSFRSCQKYVKHPNPQIYRDDPLAACKDEIHDCCQDIEGLETSIRDWLQLRYGSLALEESKRSIELSDLQITESKRGGSRTPISQLVIVRMLNRYCSQNL